MKTSKLKTLGIIGSGHFGQQIAHLALSDGHYEKVVFFDDYNSGKIIANCNVVGKIDDIINAFGNNVFDQLLIGVGYKHMKFRREIFNKFRSKIPFGSLIHSSCTIDSSVILGVGNILYPGCILDANVKLENNILLNLGVCIAHDSVIESHCFIAPRVSLAGFVKIGEMSNLGINTCVIDNISIASQIRTGGGTLIIKDIKERGLYVGSPARLIKYN